MENREELAKKIHKFLIDYREENKETKFSVVIDSLMDNLLHALHACGISDESLMQYFILIVEAYKNGVAANEKSS